MGNNLSSGSDSNGRNTSGNSQDTIGVNVPNIPLLRRTTGSLGLTRAELDKRCKPSGLYATCTWDERSIRREIGDGRLAARLVGKDGSSSSADVECPICFLNYSDVNETTCCKAHICTECFLQIRPAREDPFCPFCNSPSLKVKTAMIKNDKKECSNNANDAKSDTILGERDCPVGKNDGEFGSVLLKSRTESMSSEDTSDETRIATISPEERGKIEAEMRQQNDHPVMQRIDIEAAELRREHDLTYLRSNSGMRRLLSRSALNGRSRIGGRGLSTRGRNFNDMVRAFEQSYGEDRMHSLDDLVMLEAAIVLSMEQEAARRARGENGENTNTAEQGRSGFSMLQALIQRRLAAEGQQNDEESTDEEDVHMARLERRRRERRNNRRGGLFLDHHSSESTAMHSLAMRGLSEEQQMEMAIAASLRESHAPAPNSNNTSSDSVENTHSQEVVDAPSTYEREDVSPPTDNARTV